MITALFIIDKNFGKLDENIIRAYIFDIAEDIFSLGNEMLYMKNPGYISSWLAKHKIEEIYYENMDIETKEYFENLGFKLKPLTKLRDPLMKFLLLFFIDN